MRRREAGFGNHNVDGMLVVASTGILAAFVVPALTKEPGLTGSALWIFLGIAAAGFALSFFIALLIPHGVGMILAPAQWIGAGAGFAIAWLAGMETAARHWTTAGGYAVLPPVAAFVALEVLPRIHRTKPAP